MKTGVIVSTKVDRPALQNAATILSLPLRPTPSSAKSRKKKNPPAQAPVVVGGCTKTFMLSVLVGRVRYKASSGPLLLPHASMEPIPYEVLEAMVQCFGRCFHFKDAMESFLSAADVERTLVAKDKHEHKFIWARRLLSELGGTAEGRVVQRKILSALVKLRKLPDEGVKDREDGLNGLRDLKEIALRHQLIVKKERENREDRERVAEERERLLKVRAERLESLRKRFFDGPSSANRQAAGYSLEDILADLFNVFEIGYTPSYRTDTQQIDGHFKFEGFDYLVEAKCRADRPTEQEIGGFQRMPNGKL